jgi:hypothetical protein
MPDLRQWLGLPAMAWVAAMPAFAQTEKASPTVSAHAAPLTAGELKTAIAFDPLTVPTPGEVFAAIDKGGKPNWSSQYRPPMSFNSTSRAQVALNLGTLIADGYIAVEAQDGQQVKNIGRDVFTLSKKLSVSDSVLARGKSITHFAENGAWAQLNEELEATQNEVKKALEENRDGDLITLVSVGGWIRGTQVVTGLLMQNYNVEDAKLLRQPALVSYLREKLENVSPKLRQDKIVGEVSDHLRAIAKLVNFPADHVPSAEEVRNLNGLVAEITQRIANVP